MTSPLSPETIGTGLDFLAYKRNNAKGLILKDIRKKRTFELGDCIRQSQYGRIKFGRIIGFLHPDGLYSESCEKGYNGKDFLECVEISGRAGLPRKVNPDGDPKTFTVHSKKPKHATSFRWARVEE